MWTPDRRTRRSIGGTTLTYLTGETEGAYLLEGATVVVVYPSEMLTTAARRKLITSQLSDPDPVYAAVGALVAAGLTPAEFSVESDSAC